MTIGLEVICDGMDCEELNTRNSTVTFYFSLFLTTLTFNHQLS